MSDNPKPYHKLSVREKAQFVRPDGAESRIARARGRSWQPPKHLFSCARCGTQVNAQDAAGHVARCPGRPFK